MEKNPNSTGLIAMFIALLMIAALGPTKASVNVPGYPDVQYAFDIGPPIVEMQAVTVQNCDMQIMIDRGVAIPIIELTTGSLDYTLENKTITSIPMTKNRQVDKWFTRAREKI